MTPLKWVSPTGALIGTFTIPDAVFNLMRKTLERYPHEEFSDFEFLDRTRLPKRGDVSNDPKAMIPSPLVKMRKLRYHDVGECYGILTHTPEEFERIPGCTFSPSVAYVRSLING